MSRQNEQDGRAECDCRVWHMRPRLMREMQEQQIRGSQPGRQQAAMPPVQRPMRQVYRGDKQYRDDVQRQDREQVD